ncbi:AlkZ-related protein [Actomonas aquatica]|uniref:Uncharacterized protein n=1 Tax=Actomonas aquatica TaxID=2866162 RepID=A0ABZ1C7A0_9BACT|nr:hypothetical protein [Opitutus sp. WL0086]WRQ87469.1 hypothetical protein K1X11_021860 [Opitutus sp. WL0086]
MPSKPPRPTVKTREDALAYVQRIGVCTLFSSKGSGLPALWDVVALPAEGGGRTKWGARVEAIWAWKNELPAAYPDDVFYGKIKGGHAVLMSMDHLRDVHYPAAHQPVSACSELAQKLYDIIRVDPTETAELRTLAIERTRCTKSRFETALKQLQITLNIARTNDPDATNDRWVPWSEQYPDIG